MPRSNKKRTEQTRADLIAAGRRLFVEKGYADTATPDIVAAAGVTRGALYHHFEDKKELFRAVVEQESQTVAAAIEGASPANAGAIDALVKGGDAYLDVMRGPGRTRLLLLEGPAVLGRKDMDQIDEKTSAGSLRAGVAHAVRSGELRRDLSVDAATALLSAAFDRAALAIEAGGDLQEYRMTMAALILGLARN